jgi:hypothetical protein
MIYGTPGGDAWTFPPGHARLNRNMAATLTDSSQFKKPLLSWIVFILFSFLLVLN